MGTTVYWGLYCGILILENYYRCFAIVVVVVVEHSAQTSMERIRSPQKPLSLLKGPTQGLSLFSSPNQLFRKMSDTSSSEALREGMA